MTPPPPSTPSAPRTVQVPLTAPQAIEQTSALVWDGSATDGSAMDRSAMDRSAMDGAAAVILAHGAGTDMHHRHMQRHAVDLAQAGHPVALFNFAYTEMGRRRPDPAPRLISAWRDAIATLRPILGADRKLVIGGRSMGGRIATMVAADPQDQQIDGVVGIAYPLHPPGRPDRLRVDHWPALRAPVLILSGTRDSMAPTLALEHNVAEFMPKSLATVKLLEGADHSFRVRKSDGQTEDEVFTEASQVITEWIARSVC